MAKAKTSDDSRMNMTKVNLLGQLQQAEKKLAEEQSRNNDRQAKLNLVRNETTVQNAQETDVKGIIQDFRVNLNDGLSGFEQQLYSSKEKLDEVQAAIRLEEQNLADVFEIKKNSLTLQSLINSIEETDEKFRLHKSATKEEWEKEQADHLIEIEERDLSESKKWNRKLEEARYEFNLKVKKDEDLWDQSKLVRERTLKEQENSTTAILNKKYADIKAQEKDIADLRVRVENFDNVKQEAIDEAVKKALSSEKTSRHFEKSAMEKEHNSTAKILQNDNVSLAAINERLTSENKELKLQLEAAYGKIQETSLEVIKGAAQSKVIVNQEAQKVTNGK